MPRLRSESTATRPTWLPVPDVPLIAMTGRVAAVIWCGPLST